MERMCVLSARRLHQRKRDIVHTRAQGKCDPYCIVESGSARFQTEHKKKTYDADFNEIFKLVDGLCPAKKTRV